MELSHSFENGGGTKLAAGVTSHLTPVASFSSTSSHSPSASVFASASIPSFDISSKYTLCWIMQDVPLVGLSLGVEEEMSFLESLSCNESPVIGCDDAAVMFADVLSDETAAGISSADDALGNSMSIFELLVRSETNRQPVLES